MRPVSMMRQLRWSSYQMLGLLVANSLSCSSAAAPSSADGDSLIFDTEVMAGRGIDLKIAELFRHAPRFMPGEASVILTVNGSARGRVRVQFDHQGTLCAGRDFQSQAGLVPAPGYSDDVSCFDIRSAWPQASVLTEPGEERINLLVPPQAIRASGAESSHWQHGGSAGMLNYDAQYMNSSGNSGGVSFAQLNGEAGINLSNWIIRSRQTFSRFDGKDRINHQGAFVQRSFFGIKKVLQAGQIGLSNTLFATGQVSGFQMFPEMALTADEDDAGLVVGMAETQSVVEVRQLGVLIYSTIVPAGPFQLRDFSPLTRGNDLMVTLTGSNGQLRQFVVPAVALQAIAPRISPGISLGFGRLLQQSAKAPWLGTLSSGRQLSAGTSVNAGILGSPRWHAGAFSVDSQLMPCTRLSLKNTLAWDTQYDKSGDVLETSLGHSLTERFSVSINGRHQTPGYRELSDTLQTARQADPGGQARSRSQWGSTISWSAEQSGSFSLSWARSIPFRGNHTDYLRGSWSHQIGRSYPGVTLEHNTGTLTGQADNRLYLSFSMSLNKNRDINSYMSSARRSARAGLRYSERISDTLGWHISSDRDLRSNHTSTSGSVDYMTSVNQFSASLTQDTQHYSSWSARVSGAAVAHSDGVTLTPWRITDTFGVARVGEESDVRLDTPAGPVWTDRRGYAVLPSLPGYRRSTIQLDTRSLKKNIDIGNAWQETEMAYGAIARVNFEVIRTRRVLVDGKTADGHKLPYGASVFDQSGNFITVVDESGAVFVADAAPGMVLEVQNAGRTLCRMPLSLPQQAEAKGLYENTSAACG